MTDAQLPVACLHMSALEYLFQAVLQMICLVLFSHSDINELVSIVNFQFRKVVKFF